MKIGYTLALSSLYINKLKQEGCTQIYQEKDTISQSQLIQMLQNANKGDTIIVPEINELGRSIQDIIDFFFTIEHNNLYLKSIEDHFDTSHYEKNTTLAIFSSLKKFKTKLPRKRKGGRPRGLTEEAKLKMKAAQEMYKNKSMSINQICKTLNLPKSTFYHYLKMN